MGKELISELRELLRRCLPRIQRHDPAAQREFIAGLGHLLPGLVRPQFRRKFPRLRTFLETDDIAQEVMLRSMRSIFSDPPGTEEELERRVWLGISRTLIDLVRKYYGPEGDGSHLRALPPVPRDPPTTDGRAVRDARMDIPEILATLRTEDAELIVAHYYVGLEIQEIADMRGEHRGTTSRHHMRILRELGDQLGI